MTAPMVQIGVAGRRVATRDAVRRQQGEEAGLDLTLGEEHEVFRREVAAFLDANREMGARPGRAAALDDQGALRRPVFRLLREDAAG